MCNSDEPMNFEELEGNLEIYIMFTFLQHHSNFYMHLFPFEKLFTDTDDQSSNNPDALLPNARRITMNIFQTFSLAIIYDRHD